MSRNSVKKQGGKQAMREICWTAADLKELSEKVPDGESVAILHLLRYRDSVGTGRNDMTGRQSFERYFQGSLPILMKVGARPLWRGQVRFVLFGGEVERWDEAVLVTFPTLGAFQRMLADERHEAEMPFRTAALEDSRVIAMVMPRAISRVAWWLTKISIKLRGKRLGGREIPGWSV